MYLNLMLMVLPEEKHAFLEKIYRKEDNLDQELNENNIILGKLLGEFFARFEQRTSDFELESFECSAYKKQKRSTEVI